jgi:hypothetical protein
MDQMPLSFHSICPLPMNMLSAGNWRKIREWGTKQSQRKSPQLGSSFFPTTPLIIKGLLRWNPKIGMKAPITSLWRLNLNPL